MARHWTQEERQRQAELIRRWRPWALSSGAKTREGKAASSRNAYKGGLRQQLRELSKSMNEMLREQRERLKRIE